MTERNTQHFIVSRDMLRDYKTAVKALRRRTMLFKDCKTEDCAASQVKVFLDERGYFAGRRCLECSIIMRLGKFYSNEEEAEAQVTLINRFCGRIV